MKSNLTLCAFALTALALTAAAPAAHADGSSALLDIVASGTLPETDSPEEAAVCAAESGYMSAVFEDVEGTTQETLDSLDDQATYWLERAAAINGMRPLEYLGSPEYLDTFLGLADIDDEVNMQVALACADRIR